MNNLVNTDELTLLAVSGLTVEIVRKEIKNLHLGVYPPAGRVRVAAPPHVSNDRVRLAVIAKLQWIRKQQSLFDKQLRQSEREMISGESHYFLGKRYRLEVIERKDQHEVKRQGHTKLILYVNPNTTTENRQLVLNEWYRSQLKQRLPKLLDYWQNKIGVKIQAVGIKKMKTKWGSCSNATKSIWLNLELAKKPPECLEYILVHELTHLLERHHNEQFRAHMDHFLPNWRLYRETLNTLPLANENWRY